MTVQNRIELCGAMDSGFERVLTPEALEVLAELERRFGPRRRELLERRVRRRSRLRAGEMLDFLPETRELREGDWRVAPPPPDMQQRWVEITGPTDRKMLINALNSGADGFMADFEDANSPTWRNMVDGQINLSDAIAANDHLRGIRTAALQLGERVGDAAGPPARLASARAAHAGGRRADLRRAVRLRAVLLPLRRGCCWRTERDRISTCPKMESHLEARLWNDVFCFSEEAARDPSAERSGRRS